MIKGEFKMARCYFGDIEGKCWFGVQSSDWADRFGGEKRLSYDFDVDCGDLEKVENEVSFLENKLGSFLEKLDKFFDENNGYSDERLAKHLNITEEDLRLILSDYADYKSGLQIKECLEREGRCQFEVEL